MRRACRHPNVFARIWAKYGRWIILLGDSKHGDARQCGDCHAWLPLGPSSDDSPEVAIEIRAAEIAVNVDEFRLGMPSPDACNWLESEGWYHHEAGLTIYAEDHAPTQSGYLARAISSHATTEGE